MTQQVIRDVAKSLSDLAKSLAVDALYGENWLENVKEDASVRAVEIAVALYELKEAHKALDGQLRRVYHVHNNLDKSVLPKKLEDEDLDMIRVPEIGRSFSVRDMTTASMLDKDKAFQWLRSIGSGDIIQETVNAGTLASFCRNLMLEQGLEPPEDAVKINSYKTISINRYTPKGTAK